MEQSEFVTVKEAREILGVSKQKIAELLKREVLHAEEQDILNKRVKWIRRTEVEELAAKSPSAPKKAA